MSGKWIVSEAPGCGGFPEPSRCIGKECSNDAWFTLKVNDHEYGKICENCKDELDSFLFSFNEVTSNEL